MLAGPAPVFLLSFRQRGELTAMTERCGWLAVGARRVDAAERRFIGSGAAIAVVDARGAFAEGLAAVRTLADAVEANGGALLMLLSRGDVAALAQVHAAGATQYLASPFGEAEYCQALRFAERHAERIGGHGAATRTALAAGDALTWQWRRGTAMVTLSAALAQSIGRSPGPHAIGGLARELGASGLRRARAAVRAVVEQGLPTAFAHDAEGARVVHHVQSADGMVTGRVEELEERAVRPVTGGRDPLTGLSDANAARAWLGSALRPPAAGEGGVAVLLLSVSRFEIINAAFGRGVGDALLRIVARRIERLALRGRRLIARMAGAEFIVGLPAPATMAEAAFLGRALVDAACRPFVAGEHVVTLGAHVGIAVAEAGEIDAAALLRRASGALADAKAGDGSPVRLLSAREEDAAAEASRLEVDLRSALTGNEIELLYQPQISVPTGRIVGVEALARWRHPRLGELGAETLFAAAERSDYLVQLSQHVQRQVVAEVARWPASLAHLRVAINITAVEMAAPAFAEGFLALIDEAGVPRPRITVEVTETGLIEDLNVAADLLAALRAGGLRVAIDDFGTGYSSLAYLKALPLDYLKIDKRLSQDISGSVRDRIVVRGVIDMARSLGLAVVAEGVETAEQLSLLAREGCNFYQGYLSAPPLDLPALEAMVAGAAMEVPTAAE